MLSNRTRGELHKLVPVPSLLLTASPVLLQVMKHGLPSMIQATALHIVLLFKLFVATFMNTPQFSIFCVKKLLFFRFFLLLGDSLLLKFLIISINRLRNNFLWCTRVTLDAFFRPLHCIALEKCALTLELVSYLFSWFGLTDAAVHSRLASLELLELVPVVDDLVAAGPSFLEVVEDRFS